MNYPKDIKAFYITGLSNVREAIPFPRTPGNAKY